MKSIPYLTSEDPTDYDLSVLRSLHTAYREILCVIRNDKYFDLATDLFPEYGSGNESTLYEAAFRHTLHGLAAARFVKLEPRQVPALWSAYFRVRVLPSVMYNSLTGSTHTGRGLADDVDFEKAYLISLSALLEGSEALIQLQNGAAAWLNHVGGSLTILRSADTERRTRYRSDRLHELSAGTGLAAFESDTLKRSQMLKPVTAIVAAIAGWSQPDIGFTAYYDTARQLLDDVSDVREDLLGGRVSLPVVRAMRSPDVGGRIVESIEALWADHDTGRERVERLLDQIIETDAFEQTLRDAESRLDKFEAEAIRASTENGADGLLQLSYLKRAFVERLRRHDFRDVRPDMTRLHSAISTS